jgi:hypothetical protein
VLQLSFPTEWWHHAHGISRVQRGAHAGERRLRSEFSGHESDIRSVGRTRAPRVEQPSGRAQANSQGHQASATSKESVAAKTACNEVGSIPSMRIVFREFLTHGPSLTPDPTRKLKGKGQGDPKPLAHKRRHS